MKGPRTLSKHKKDDKEPPLMRLVLQRGLCRKFLVDILHPTAQSSWSPRSGGKGWGGPASGIHKEEGLLLSKKPLTLVDLQLL